MQSRLVALALILALIAPAHAQQVTTTWVNSTSPTVTGYRVYRRTPTGTYALIGTAATAPFIDTSAVPGATYMYVATATDGTTESIYSNEAAAVIPGGPILPPLPPPTGLTSLWPTSATPANVTGIDGNSLELGVKFTASVPGAVVGIRFYKATNSTGAHTGSLWNSTGGRLATANSTGETPSGWQTVTFAAPVNITAGASYTVSYHTIWYPWSPTYFTTARSVPPLTAPANAGVYRYGTTSAMPASIYNAANYWVDVLFQPGVVPVSINISPTNTSLLTGGTDRGVQQFAATVSNATNTGVTWTATGGSVNSTGLYTTGTTPGMFTVTATAATDTTKTAAASVTINPPPPTLSVDCLSAKAAFTAMNIPAGVTLTINGVAGGATATCSIMLP